MRRNRTERQNTEKDVVQTTPKGRNGGAEKGSRRTTVAGINIVSERHVRKEGRRKRICSREREDMFFLERSAETSNSFYKKKKNCSCKCKTNTCEKLRGDMEHDCV